MPNLPKEMFETPPKVGDRVTVEGSVESIDKDGNVEISYDKVETLGDQGDEDGMEMPKNAGDALDDYVTKQKGETQ